MEIIVEKARLEKELKEAVIGLREVVEENKWQEKQVKNTWNDIITVSRSEIKTQRFCPSKKD
jgi:hypothetical protein